MPLLIAAGVGLVAGIYVSNKTADLAMVALAGGAIFVGGKYVKAW